jgi:hypothetical protein
MKWMSGSAKRECDRALAAPGTGAPCRAPSFLAKGDTVILAESDSNGIKITV